MTRQDLAEIITADPVVQVVHGSSGQLLSTVLEMALPEDDEHTVRGMTSDDAFDRTLIQRAERWFDLPENALRNHVVIRPKEGRILISEQGVYGQE